MKSVKMNLASVFYNKVMIFINKQRNRSSYLIKESPVIILREKKNNWTNSTDYE